MGRGKYVSKYRFLNTRPIYAHLPCLSGLAQILRYLIQLLEEGKKTYSGPGSCTDIKQRSSTIGGEVRNLPLPEFPTNTEQSALP